MTFEIVTKRLKKGRYDVHLLQFRPSEGESIAVTIAGDIPTYGAFLEKIRQATLSLGDLIDQRLMSGR